GAKRQRETRLATLTGVPATMLQARAMKGGGDSRRSIAEICCPFWHGSLDDAIREAAAVQAQARLICAGTRRVLVHARRAAAKGKRAWMQDPGGAANARARGARRRLAKRRAIAPRRA